MIATRFPKSWSIPKFDIKDPSLRLYLPLWYPDSETTGSTITSKDIYRRVGTVTGATWGSQGRTYTAGGNTITVASPFGDVSLKVTAFSVGVWVKFNALGATQEVLGIKPTTAGNFGLKFTLASSDVFVCTFIRADNDNTGRVAFADTSKTLSASTWYHLLATYDGNGTPDANTFKLYVNGTDYAIPILVAGYSGGAWSASNNTVYTGSYSGANAVNGIIGADTIYNRVLTASERPSIYQVTKWRYIS